MMTNVRDLRKWKSDGLRFTMLTCYDYSTARWLDRAGIPVLLVGDSLGTTILGYPDTLSVTMDDMVRHAGAVVRGAPGALVIGDMPFMAYHASPKDAIRNAGRFLQEARVSAVKMEGGGRVIDYTKRLTAMGIPVMGHLGLTPQSVHRMGGFVVQGREEEQARAIFRDAQALERAGCYSVVLEGVPKELARDITASLRIPTIGIGAGIDCDGQVLVCYDLFGFNPDFKPKFVKRFADGYGVLRGAAEAFCTEVRGGTFPGDEYSFTSKVPLRLLPGQGQASSGTSGEPEKVGPIYGVPV
jgi:3-methyl-2-oxobutanoate hydroxymethyltransferase